MTSESGNTTDPTPFELSINSYQWSLEILIAVFSILGNCLVMVAVGVTPSLQTISNYFVVNLAMTDLLVGLIAIPLSLAVTLGHPRDDYYGCLAANCLVVVFTQVSVFSLVGIAVDRFVAVGFPLHYTRIFTRNVCLVICLVTWISGALVGFIPLFGWNLGAPSDGVCSFIAVISLHYMVYFNFFACIIPPLAAVFVVYAYIFTIVLKHSRGKVAQATGHATSHTRPKIRASELRAARSLAIVIVVFALCWLPVHICNSLLVIGGQYTACPNSFFIFNIFLSHANSMLNPFIYAVSNSIFRRSFAAILRCRMPRIQPESFFNNSASC